MSALFGDDLVIVDFTPLPIEKLWGKIVIAIRHSTGTAYAGFLQKLELDNRPNKCFKSRFDSMKISISNTARKSLT